MPRSPPGPRLRVVALGGGTGLPVVLRGLRARAELTAVVATSDDGGSSGRLRRALGIVAPGDLRNCLVAMAANQALSPLFQFRFRGGKKSGVWGHTLGNLVLAALCELRGDMLQASRVTAELLGVRGEVLPATLEPVLLCAEVASGRVVRGERRIGRSAERVERLFLDPPHPAPAPGVLEAIRAADLVVLGPGSLFTSVVASLLVEGVADALASARGLKVLVQNLMTQPGETDGMTAADHVRAVQRHAGRRAVDVVLCPREFPGAVQLARCQACGAQPVRLSREELVDLGVVPVVRELVARRRRVRHSPALLARALLELGGAARQPV